MDSLVTFINSIIVDFLDAITFSFIPCVIMKFIFLNRPSKISIAKAGLRCLLMAVVSFLICIGYIMLSQKIELVELLGYYLTGSVSWSALWFLLFIIFHKDKKSLNSLQQGSFAPQPPAQRPEQSANLLDVKDELAASFLTEGSQAEFFIYGSYKYDKNNFVKACTKKFSALAPDKIVMQIVAIEKFIFNNNYEAFYPIVLEAFYKALLSTYPAQYDAFIQQHGNAPFKTKNNQPVSTITPIKNEEIKELPVQNTAATNPPQVETAARYCQYCGKPIDRLSKRCTGCGKKFFFVR